MRLKDFGTVVLLIVFLLDATCVLFYWVAYMLNSEAYAGLPYGISPFLLIGVLLALLLGKNALPAPRKVQVTEPPYGYKASRF